MNNLISAARTAIVIGAIASFSVGCKQATTPAPADSVATTTAPATDSAANGTGPTSVTDKAVATHSANSVHATGSSQAGATNAGMGTDATDTNKNPRSGVKNNSGETQGTTPNTSLPVSDGSR